MTINNNNSDNYILKDLRFKYQKCQIKNQNSRLCQSQQSYSYTCFKHSQMYVLKNVSLQTKWKMIFPRHRKCAWPNVWIEAMTIYESHKEQRFEDIVPVLQHIVR